METRAGLGVRSMSSGTMGTHIVRELLLGPQRFSDLRGALPSASSNVITDRLRELERHGVVRRGKMAPPAGSWVYELTEWGREIEPVLLALGGWASAWTRLARRPR